MININPYLAFPGTCEDAFKFYEQVFNAKISRLERFSDMPQQDDLVVPEPFMNKIMHIALPISNEAILMGSDGGDEWSPKMTTGNNVTLSVAVDTNEEADRIFEALAEDGKIAMPMGITFWGEYFGMCTDKYDINWMISSKQKSK
jgi:PhnB protein